MQKGISFFAILILFNSCTNSEEKNKIEESSPTITQAESHSIQEFAVGDVDGDGKPDMATIYPPEIREDGLSCTDDSCIVAIRFEGSINELRYPFSIGGFVEDLGDLDGDGGDELLYVPDWFQSCWGSLHVFSYKNGSWAQLAKTGLNWCNEDRFSDRIKLIDAGVLVLEGEVRGDAEGEILTRFDTVRLIP